MSRLVDKALKTLNENVENQEFPEEIRAKYEEARSIYLSAKKVRGAERDQLIASYRAISSEADKMVARFMKKERKFPVARRVVSRLADSEFARFSIPLIVDAEERVEMYRMRADIKDVKSIMDTISAISMKLSTIKSEELEFFRKRFFGLKSRFAAVEKDTETAMQKLRDERTLTFKSLADQEMQERAVLALEKDLPSIEEAAEEAAEEAFVEAAEEEFVEEKQEMSASHGEIEALFRHFENLRQYANNEYRRKHEEITQQKNRTLSIIHEDMTRLRESMEPVYLKVLNDHQDLTELVITLHQKTVEFPGHSQDRTRPSTKEEQEFIRSIFKTQVTAQEEKFKMVPRPQPKEVDENLMKSEMSKLLQKKKLSAAEKKFQRQKEQDVEADEAEREARGGGGDEDGGYSEERGDEEVGGYGDIQDLEDIFPEEFEPESEDEEEVEEPDQEPESEEEEEPNELDEKEDRRVVVRDKSSVPLTDGEKLLANIPILEMSDKSYREISNEILLLKGEIELVYNLYNEMEERVVKPFMKYVNMTREQIFTLLQYCYTGRTPVPLDTHRLFDTTPGKNYFVLTDEQRFVVKLMEGDIEFIRDLKHSLEHEPPVDPIHLDDYTGIPEKLQGSPQDWLAKYYPTYESVVPRIIAKDVVMYELTGRTRSYVTPEQKLLIEEFMKNSKVSLKENDEVQREMKKFKELPLVEKVKLGIPVLPEISTTLLETMLEIRTRLVNAVEAMTRVDEKSRHGMLTEVVKITKNQIFDMLRYAYNGKPFEMKCLFDAPPINSCFSLTDDQRYALELVRGDAEFAEAIKQAVTNNPPSPLEAPDATEIPEKLRGSPQDWLAEYYPKYESVLPSIIAKQIVSSQLGQPYISREKELLIEEFRRNAKMPIEEMEDVKGEVQRLLELSPVEKMKIGIPIRDEVVTDKRTGAPVFELVEESEWNVRGIERIAPYIPSLLMDVLNRNRKRISDTRSRFVRKFILSCLTPEQYIYVKVFMSHPETRGDFERLIDRLRDAHMYAVYVEKKGLSALSEIQDETLQGMVLELIDNSVSGSVNELFLVDQKISEYEKEFRKLVPVEQKLPKAEYTFLKNARYHFRRKYLLTFPVIGSVNDMKAVEQVLSERLVKRDDGYDPIKMGKIKSRLAEINKDFADVNLEYQKSMVYAIVNLSVQLFINERIESLRTKCLLGTASSTIISYLGRDNRSDAEKKAEKLPVEQIVSGMLELNSKLDKTIKFNREKYFTEVDSLYSEEITSLVSLLKATHNLSQIPEELEEHLLSETSVKKPSRMKAMAKAINKRAQKFQKEIASDLSLQSEKYTTEELMRKITYIKQIPKELILTQSGKYTDKDILSMYLTYYDLLYRYVVCLMKEKEVHMKPVYDKETGKVLREEMKERVYGFDKYMEAYKKLLDESPDHFKMSGLPKKVIAGKFLQNIYPDIKEVEASLRRHYENEHVIEQSANRVKKSYVDNFPRVYHWEDKGQLRVHPELLKVMANFVLYKEDASENFMRAPAMIRKKDENGKIKLVASKYVYPSILFFHTMLNSEVMVQPTDDGKAVIVMNDKVYRLGIRTEKKIASVVPSDCEHLLRTASLRRVVDVFHSDLVVIPSLVDRQMVMEIAEETLFYPGYLRDVPVNFEEKVEKELAELNEDLQLFGVDTALEQSITQVQRKIPSIPALQKIEREIDELQKLKSMQKDEFTKDVELNQLLLKRDLINGGWKRANINLVREINASREIRDGKIRVKGIDYTCGLIIKNRIVPLEGDRILQMVIEYYEQRQSEYIEMTLQAFIPTKPSFEIEEDEEDEEFSGTKKKQCVHCKKEIGGKEWNKTVQFVDGKSKVVPLCSEKCSEKYRPM